jgi:tRNA A37 threonylcarbamoyladenosine modification protein TsaB
MKYFTEINQETFNMKMIHQLFAATTIALTTIPSLTMIAKAAPNNAAAGCESITDPLRRGNCYSAIATAQAQQDLIRNWTPRQHAIAKAIGNLYNAYYQQTKRPLPINRTTVNRVAQALKANSAEVPFITNRMQANYNAIVSINQADATITGAQQFLDCLQTQGTGCVPNF